MYHTLADVETTSFPHAVSIKYANDLFVHQQNAGRLDDKIEDEVIGRLVQDAYYDIFGIRHDAYLNPDAKILPERKHYLDVLHTWGRSIGHGRTAQQATKEEMAAIAQITGTRIPLTPAAAAGGRADRGGYYPHQAPKGKGAGRSIPYPQSSSSDSSWWASSNWGNWSWSSWSGRNWRS